MRDPDERLLPSERAQGGGRPPRRPSESIAYMEAEARYTRERLQIYRARQLQGRPVRGSHLRELERAAEGAAARLRRARERAAADAE